MTYQGRPSGSVSAFAIDPSDGNLTFLNTRPTGGTAPCHLTLDPSGKWLFVANYGSGNVSVFPLNEDGTIGESTDLIQHHGKGTNPERQEGPHAHQVVFDKNHDLLFVNDLGLDKVFMYRFNHTTGKLSPASPPWFRTPPGFGPRHLAIGKKGKTIYVLGEMASSVSVFTFSPGSQPEEIQEISMLPEEFNGENTGAEIVLSPDGKFLFASNRGDNSLAEYSIDPGSGKLKLNHFYSSGGIDPRFFCFDPTGKYIFSANQTSENIIVYKYNKTNGELTPTGIEIKLPKPVCMAFLHK
jgi:6-phosphogluconolactonase